MGSPVIFSGNNAKVLKNSIDLNGLTTIQSGNIDPTQTATTGNKGSLYLSTLTGFAYVKRDAASSTNWSSLNNISPLTAVGDMLYYDATLSNAKLSIGSAGQILTTSLVGGSLIPQWATLGPPTVQTFSGDGSTTTFSLATAPGSVNAIQVYVSGVYQQKSTYTVSGTTLTFTQAPPAQASSIEVASGNTVTPATTVTASTVVSSAATLNLDVQSINSFSGSTATWTLPSVASCVGRIYFIKNRGSGSLTINANAGASEIYNTAPIATLSVLSGNAINLVNDGGFWSVE